MQADFSFHLILRVRQKKKKETETKWIKIGFDWTNSFLQYKIYNEMYSVGLVSISFFFFFFLLAL